jgi:secreted trypsin-like serine protease
MRKLVAGLSDRPLTRLYGLALAALAVGSMLAPEARASGGEAPPRIVNGGDASITDFPYQAALYDPTSGPPSVSQFCGGVVLNSTHVLTAAHCLAVGSPGSVAVFAGAADLADTGPAVKTIPARTLSVDPAYNPATNDHDVGVVELSAPLWTGSPTSTIAPIGRISDADFSTVLGNLPTNGTVSGWGCTDPVPSGSPFCPSATPQLLQAAQVPLVSQVDCQTDYAPITPITANMFCAGAAGSDTSTNTDSCFGDSGGPLVVDDPSHPGTRVLAGLVDAGNGCAQPGFPGVYTRVSKLAAFIDAAGGGPEVSAVPASSPPPPPPAGDSTAPALRIASKRCTMTSCTLRVRVTDASPSSGIARVTATLSFSRKVKCRGSGAGASKTCTKRVHRTLRVKGGEDGMFTILAMRLMPRKRYTLSLVPFDNAGNRPQSPTTTNVRTKSRQRS